ncbi:MAG: TolC family protein, partial [Proteobacteria bacterium]|nr:TolC family protein [Pseudomonadota bacterium]
MQACNAAHDSLRNKITSINNKISPNIHFLSPFLVLAPFLALVIITLSFPAQGQTLQEELRRLVAEHPRLKAEDNNVKAAKEGVRSAFANFLPKAGVTGNVGPERVDKPERRSIGLEPTELTRQKITFSLTQDLFTGFRNEETYKASKVQKEIAELNRDATRQGLLLEGITAYYSVLRQSRLIDVAVQNEKTIKEQLALEDERVERGAGIAVDILFAKTRLQLAKERRVQLEGTLSTAIARYKQAFSHAPNIGAMKVPDLKPGLVSKTRNQALEIAHR